MGFFDSIFGKKKEEKKTEDKRICPVCGNSFTGRGMDVHDGIICLDCWELVMDDFEMGRMDEDKDFYIAPIKAAVLAKKGEIASDKAAKAEKPIVCPICGGKMPKLLTAEVKDGYICDECFHTFNELEENGETDKALEDKRSVKDEIPKFVLLKDNQKICAECAEKVRLLYPVLYTQTHDSDGDPTGSHLDTLHNITLAEFRKALEDVTVKRQQLEEQYGSCEAVISVGSVGRDFENARTSPGKKEYLIRGKILFGKASTGDMIQAGSGTLMRIDRLRQITGFEEYTGNVVDSVGEGYYAIVTVAEDVSCIYPGDTLIIV